MSTFIVGKERETLFRTDLAKFPQFFRFDTVELFYGYYWGNDDSTTITEKCQLFTNYLKQKHLKDVLNGSNIHFIGSIEQTGCNHFTDHSHLLHHIQKELLPISEFSRGYKFDISFNSDFNSGTNLIVSLLQMIQSSHCSALEIRLNGLSNRAMHLPIQAILNWLNRRPNAINEMKKERLLRIFTFNVQNTRELCNRFKTAWNFFLVFFLILSYNFEIVIFAFDFNNFRHLKKPI